jgi:hypothetical protein
MNIIKEVDFDELNDKFNDKDNYFRHVVVDNFLQPDLAEELYNQLPPVTDSRWYHFRNKIFDIDNLVEPDNYGISKVEDMPGNWGDVFRTFQTEASCKWMEKVTGIKNLVPDDYNEIGQWSGLRYIKKGGFQLVHSDARLHPHLNLEKRITVVGYLNKDWVQEDTGYLEFWTDDMKECWKRVEPKFNRVAIFENSEFSNHGIPHINKDRRVFMYTLLCKDSFEETRTKAWYKPRPDEHRYEEVKEVGIKRLDLSDY